MGMKATERMRLYGNRAHASSNGSKGQKKYAKLAIAEMDALLELSLDKETNMFFNMNMLYMKTNMLSMTDQPEVAIDTRILEYL